MSPFSFKQWINEETIPFSLDSSSSFNTAVDRLMTVLNPSLDLLAMGEALHGGEEIMLLRNRFFQRLVETQGYTAIAMESCFPKARIVDDYIHGRGSRTCLEASEAGFSHGLGRLEANRELVEWMREYNAVHPVKIRFYGFDNPSEMTGTDSPRQTLYFALAYLTEMDPSGGKPRRARIDDLLGADADWENPAAMMDLSQSIGLSPSANALRIETEDLITQFQIHGPEWASPTGADRYREALQYAVIARQLLNYHAGLARPSDERTNDLLAIRDAMMADNLSYCVTNEEGRGKVLAFAHNRHMQRGMAKWQLGPYSLAWWPAGAHLALKYGSRYAVIGTGLGESKANGIDRPDPGTLEAMLVDSPGPARLIPTYRGQNFRNTEIETLPVRAGSQLNQSYFPFGPESFNDFDWLAVLDSTTYSRGGPPLQLPPTETGKPT